MQQERIDAWSAELAAGRLPEAIGERVDALLFKPDKMSLEWKALDQAAHGRGMSPQRVLALAGALAGPEDYFMRRFRFERFPNGTGFPALEAPRRAAATAPARARRRSPSTMPTPPRSTTRFPWSEREGGRLRIGIHIAAPALYFGRGEPARGDRPRAPVHRRTFPGGKITMLPEPAVEQSTLAQGRSVPALSLYLDVDGASLEVLAHGIAPGVGPHRSPTCGMAELDTRLNDEAVAAGFVAGPHGEDLFTLWRLARALKALRGAGEERSDRLDYNIRVAEGRVAIEPRRRGTPVDMVVSELMIYVNSTWGKWLAEHGAPAIYRNQKGTRTRMEVDPAAHEWLGVSHYAWTSSPLRRYCDLANQRQLAALLREEPPPIPATSSPPPRAISRMPTTPMRSTSGSSSATGACAT